MIFEIFFAQNNLYFGSKIRKIVYPCITQFYKYNVKVGFKGVFIAWICFPGVLAKICMEFQFHSHIVYLEELKILLKHISLKIKYCMLWNTNEIILNGTESKHKTKTIHKI